MCIRDRFNPGLVMSAVSLGVLSFLGFDGIATLSEEAKEMCIRDSRDGKRASPLVVGHAHPAEHLLVAVLHAHDARVGVLVHRFHACLLYTSRCV